MIENLFRLSLKPWRSVSPGFIGLIVVLAGCGPDLPISGQSTPIVYDQAAIHKADTLLILVPGALTSVEMFDQLKAMQPPGVSFVSYRFPGYDGLPIDHRLAVEHAAEEIAEFANRYPHKPVRLLGYSTGGTIAVLASARMVSRDIKVAALSPAVPLAGGVETAVRVSGDVISSAIRARPLNRESVWLEYYRTLLFGRAGRSDAALDDRIEALAAQKQMTLEIPPAALARAHSGDLRRWRLADNPGIDAGRIRFFVGLNDPVFSTAQTLRFARALGGVTTIGYPGEGHLMFTTRPKVFADILQFFQAP